MTAFRVWISRLLASFGWTGRTRDLEDDIAVHLDLLARDLEARGMSPEEARFAARRQFGPVAGVQEHYREHLRAPAVDAVAQDVRYALRTMARAPAFTIVAVLTLALGIGANAAIFQVLYTLVIKPLPVRDSHLLVELQPFHDDREQGFSYPILREMIARQDVLEGIAASSTFTLRDARVDGRVPQKPPKGLLANGDYFRVIGTEPQLGRFFTRNDDREAATPVAVISHGFWQREFGGASDTLGKIVLVKGVHLTIIGVARSEFFGESVGSRPDLWVPLSLVTRLEPGNSITAAAVWLWPMGRLRPDVTRERAQAALTVLYDSLKPFTIRTKDAKHHRLDLLPAAHGKGSLHEEFGRPLWILMATVGMLALIACCNLANLLLARATARTHEIGVRLALGATRARLIRQLLTESALLAATGTAFALALSAMMAQVLVELATFGQEIELSLDAGWQVPAFTAGVAAMATLIFGVIPAFASTHVNVSPALQGGRRTHTGSRSRHRASNAFVVAQVALCLMLVGGACLLSRSFWKLTHQDYGYQPDRVIVAYLDFEWENFKSFFNPAFRAALYHKVQAVPGFRRATISMGGPLGNLADSPRLSLPDGRTSTEDVSVIRIYPHYFETLGIPIVAGRSIGEDDRKGAPAVAVISETAARTHFGRENPIGRPITLGPKFEPARAIQIVGVSRDIRYEHPREPHKSVVFVPMEQMRAFSVPEIVLRIDPASPPDLQPLREAIRSLAPGLDLWGVKTLGEAAAIRLRRERMLAWLSAAFGVLALVLASIGLYGVVSYRVQMRTQEIGIRLALGATKERVRTLLLRDVVQLVGIGLTIGLTAMLAFTGVLASILYGVSPRDPATLLAAALVLTLVALTAAFLPVRRASLVDPMKALRTE